MSRADKIIGNFHIPSTDKHPDDSIGNQQIWDRGRQVGSIEYIPDESGRLDLNISTPDGKIFKKI